MAFVEVPKEDLLRMLIAECLAPEDAKKIIGSGHTPEAIKFTVGFEP